MAQQFRIREHVTYDNIRATQQFRATQGKQAGIARSGSDEINFSNRLHRVNLTNSAQQ